MRCIVCTVRIGQNDWVIEVRKARIQDEKVVTDRMYPDHAEWVHFNCVRNY